MKRYFLVLTFCAVSAISNSSHAFSFNDILSPSGDANNTKASGTVALDSVTNALAASATINPLVSLAANQLGIPAEYVPQIQKLYELYSAKGELVSGDVTSMENLTSWLNSAATNLNPTTLANGLNQVFSAN